MKSGTAFRLLQQAGEWCRGRNGWWRLSVLGWLGYLLIRHWGDPRYQSLIHPLNFGIHEMGHFLFMPLGQFIGIAGGTLLQLLAPLAAMVMFLKQRDYFAFAFAWGWLGTNLFDVATYAGDARALQLPLAAPWAVTFHDWNFMLTRLGLLPHDQTVAAAFRLAATVSFAVALVAGGWLVWQMFTLPAPPDKLGESSLE